MSTAFVDLGAHNGQTIIKALHQFPQCEHYYAVEPLGYLITEARRKLPEGAETKVSFCQCAVDALPAGEESSEVTLYEDLAGSRQGSSLLIDKQLNKRKESKITCLDVNFYFSTIVGRNCSLILKIDIEGKEYDVLDRLLSTGFLTERVDKLFVEWHWYKTRSISKDRHWDLIARLNSAGFPLTGHSSKDEFWSGG